MLDKKDVEDLLLFAEGEFWKQLYDKCHQDLMAGSIDSDYMPEFLGFMAGVCDRIAEVEDKTERLNRKDKYSDFAFDPDVRIKLF